MLVECPKEDEFPYPPPLDEAMSEKIYRKYVLKIDDEVWTQFKRLFTVVTYHSNIKKLIELIISDQTRRLW